MNSKMMIVLPVGEIEGEIADIMRGFSESEKKGIYICLNKPCNYRLESLKRQKIDVDNIFLLDAISGVEKIEGNNTFLAEISAEKMLSAISSIILGNTKKDYIFIESLRTIEIYEGESGLADFLMKLNKKLMENKMDLIALATDHIDYGKIMTYFDKVIKIE